MLLVLTFVLAQAGAAPRVIDEAALRRLAQSKSPVMITDARIVESVRLLQPWKSEVSFFACRFENDTLFSGFNDGVTFDPTTRFAGTTIFLSEFKGQALLFGTHFDNIAIFRGCDFRDDATFARAEFKKQVLFSDVEFHASAGFDQVAAETLTFGSGIAFHGPTDFSEAEVRKLVFHDTTFDTFTYFDDAVFRVFAAIDSTFAAAPSFSGTRFVGAVSFAGSDFKKGLDLRFADLSKASWISFERVRADPRGWALGYGYSPGRVIKLVIPLIVLFALLLIPHRHTVAAILDDDIKKGTVPQTNVSYTARLAHVLFFSTAVLLGAVRGFLRARQNKRLRVREGTARFLTISRGRRDAACSAAGTAAFR